VEWDTRHFAYNCKMRPKLIYLDTNLWNRLNDQNIDPDKLVSDLRDKNAMLVLSGQTVYEFSRTFFGSKSDAVSRAQELFKYLRRYLAAGIVCAHDVMEQLKGEIAALNSGRGAVVVFYDPQQYAMVTEEVEKLANGVPDEKAEEFIRDRRRFSESTRSDQKNHFEVKQHMKTLLNATSKSELPVWLETKVAGNDGAAILASHILRMYDNVPPEAAINTAIALLGFAPPRVSKGIVRADLYYNWRCATRGSNSKDLVDDLYHVLNASYCDIYATAEPAQAGYAPLILTGPTLVAIYDGQLPIDQWLLDVMCDDEDPSSGADQADRQLMENPS